MNNHKQRHSHWPILFMILLFSLLALAGTIGEQRRAAALPGAEEEERNDGGYTTMVDERGRAVTRTGFRLSVGDEFIDTGNRLHRVTRIEGDRALSATADRRQAFLPATRPLSPAATEAFSRQAVNDGRGVAIYHTHSDESYIPTDGSASIYAHGGIFKVGNSLTSSLKAKGLKVIHSLRPHDPHDINAYNRSRRTAVELLRQNPLALIDVHRDAVPPDVYGTIYRGSSITRVKLVVGRANPRMSANLDFAKNIKRVVDQKSPNVIEGILIAKGNYNQDLSPRAILMEVGAHTNSRYAAERGITVLAQSVPTILGVTGSVTGEPSRVPPREGGSWSAVFWLLLIVGAGLVGFLYINQEGWEGVKKRLERIWQRYRIRGGR